MNVQERLVRHVRTLERLTEEKRQAAADLKDGFDAAQSDGFDPATLKVVLKLRQLSPRQRRERRALEAIYLAALGMLEGDALPESARRRMDGQPEDPPAAPPSQEPGGDEPSSDTDQPPREEQPALVLKTPDEARAEGSAAAAAGKRIYDNPFPAGDPCRAAWDEGWCAHHQSDGMDTPAAYQRRTEKPGERSDNDQADDANKKDAA